MQKRRFGRTNLQVSIVGFGATALRESMAKEGILIRDCSTFVGLDDSYFRVTIRSSEENSKLVKTLTEALKKPD